jgi:hypothetical protein
MEVKKKTGGQKEGKAPDYKFKIVEIDGIPYRLPHINMDVHPFKGVKEDAVS